MPRMRKSKRTTPALQVLRRGRVRLLDQVPRWYPLSVVTGGTTAKMMVGAMKNDWGKKLYEGTLTRNIAGEIYKMVISSTLRQKLLLSTTSLNVGTVSKIATERSETCPSDQG